MNKVYGTVETSGAHEEVIEAACQDIKAHFKLICLKQYSLWVIFLLS